MTDKKQINELIKFHKFVLKQKQDICKKLPIIAIASAFLEIEKEIEH